MTLNAYKHLNPSYGMPLFGLLYMLKLDHLKLEFSGCLSWLGKEQKRIKASKFTDAPKAFILRQGEDGMLVAEKPTEIWNVPPMTLNFELI